MVGGNDSSRVHKILKRRLYLLLVVPYVLGIAWACAHPVVSIITGELKCRGWFIDENSLDAGNFRFDTRLNPNVSGDTTENMCEALSATDNMECYIHASSFAIAKVVPISNAITPVSEAIVLVIPASNDWYRSRFHNAMLQLIKRLASASTSPWLAKTVLIVAPTSTAIPLEETVSSFMNTYLGGGDHTLMLPPSYTTAMIRNLLVLDIQTEERPDNQVLILPQGRRGALPNMDLVFLMVTVFSRAKFMDRRYSNSQIVMHPYDEPSWTITAKKSRYVSELAHMLLFAKTLAVGPYAPHAPVLQKGIDALTFQVRFSSNSSQHSAFTFDIVERLEGVVRALSNLHERLHHSLTQYVMPSPLKFVSHSEYLIPHLLLLLPCVIRAVSLVLVEFGDEYDVGGALQVTVAVWALALGVYQISQIMESTMHLNGLVVLLYGTVPLICRRNNKKISQTLHFCTCLCAVYVILPLTLGHVALAFPTTLLFSLLIAILPRRLPNVVKLLVCFGTSPPVLVANVFGYYSSYVIFAYLPLHLLLSILWYTQSTE